MATDKYIWFCPKCKMREVTLTARPMTAHFGDSFTEGLWCQSCNVPMLPLPDISGSAPTFRLIIEANMSAAFRKALLNELNDKAADEIIIILKMDRADARNVLANSHDGQSLQCVFRTQGIDQCVFRTQGIEVKPK